MMRGWKRILPGLLTVLLVLPGCGKKEQTVAVLDGEEIFLSEAVFYTRLNQQQWEQAYVETYGIDFWTMPLGDGEETFADELKAGVMDMICEIHLLNAKAKEYGIELTKEEETDVNKRVQAFMENQSKEVKEAAGADKKLVQELLIQRVLADKVAEAVVADYEPEVTQEEAALSHMVYCLFSTLETYEVGTGYQVLSEDEVKAIRTEAEGFARRAAEIQDIRTAAGEISHTCIDVYFNDFTDGGAHELVADTVRTLEVGQTAGPIETEEGYYVIQYISELDEEATLENQEYLSARKKEERYLEIYEEWLSSAELSINQEVWDSIKIEQVLFAAE